MYLLKNQKTLNLLTFYCPHKNIIRKLSQHQSGIKQLKNEIKGLAWYQKKLGVIYIKNFKSYKNIFFLTASISREQ